jgi:opacity protein-like surface antigen
MTQGSARRASKWAFTPGWSIKLEYNYRDFGREQVDFALAGAERRHSKSTSMST